MDVLSMVLEAVQLQGHLYCRSELSAPWGVAITPGPAAVFHLIETGGGWLQMEGMGAPLALGTGDLAVIAHGATHRLGSTPTSDVTLWLDVAHPPLEHARVQVGGGGTPTIVLCGTFAAGVANPLLTGLPPLIHVPAAETHSAELGATLRLLVAEAAASRPGGATVVRRLGDVLFVQIVRAWLAQEPTAQGWLRAFHDPAIGMAMAAFHAAPGQAWTLASLAAVANLSRSAFAARFAALMGEPAGRYMTNWRMTLAAQRLQRERVTVAALADALGYASEGAFSRAFQRSTGLVPGAYRRQALANGRRNNP